MGFFFYIYLHNNHKKWKIDKFYDTLLIRYSYFNWKVVKIQVFIKGNKLNRHNLQKNIE